MTRIPKGASSPDPVGEAVPKGRIRAQRRHAAMMSRGRGQPVALSAGEKRSVGEVRVQHWERSARLLRAAKRWGALWGLAILSILVPVAHFVLVPGFLIAGPVAALARYRQTSEILGGEGACPACGVSLTIEPRADRWPFLERCQACHASVWIERIDAGAQGTDPT